MYTVQANRANKKDRWHLAYYVGTDASGARMYGYRCQVGFTGQYLTEDTARFDQGNLNCLRCIKILEETCTN